MSKRRALPRPSAPQSAHRPSADWAPDGRTAPGCAALSNDSWQAGSTHHLQRGPRSVPRRAARAVPE